MALRRVASPLVGSRRTLVRIVALAAAAMLSPSLLGTMPVRAQFGGNRPGPGIGLPEVKVVSPAPWQVFQRDINGRAKIAIALDESEKDATVENASLSPFAIDGSTFVNNQFMNNPLGDRPRFEDGKLANVPTGGPYSIQVTVKKGSNSFIQTVGPVIVGDLWILAGQSNMQGVGDLIDVTPPNPRVMNLGMDGKWKIAEEPLHWLVDSPDPVHSGDPKDRAERSAKEHKSRTKGAGLGLPFAVAMVEQTGIPIGLVACAHGGTSMEQWNQSKKGEGGKSLYGSFLRQAQLAGGKFKGVLWYQGESDAMGGEAWKIYPRVFADFIASVRADLNQPELPFYYVQIGRFVNGNDPKGWNAVQDAQRLLPERVPNTAVVSVIDLELDDLIHVGTQGLKRTGQRLAKIAQRELFGQIGATTPTLDRVSRGSQNTLIVKFKGVNLQSVAGQMAKPMGMPGMMGANQGAMAMNMAANTRAGANAGGGMAGLMTNTGRSFQSLGESSGAGLKPEHHIAGFSIRKEDGTAIPLIFEAAVGKAHDTVILKLIGPAPEKSFLWYGHGMDPYCNLVDGADMAVPVFGPIALDDVPEHKAPVNASATPAPAPAPKPANSPAPVASKEPVKLLIITGDHGHDWKATTESLKKIFADGGKIQADVTTTPAKDLTDANLAKYDVLLLNYKDTAKGTPETNWSDANKEAFLKAVREGKGLVVFHFASSAFAKPNWEEFEKAIAGGWRTQGFHGPKHVFKVKSAAKHPISEGLPAEFEHKIDELYQNSKMLEGNTVLATAYSDPKKPQGTGKDEPVIWIGSYGKGRVYNNALGHDVEAMDDPNFHEWMRRGALWAATGKVE